MRSFFVQEIKKNGKKAYLFKKCENIVLGELEDRILLNGVHTVTNIFCIDCKNILGWKYVCSLCLGAIDPYKTQGRSLRRLREIQSGSVSY